ncbi:MAG: LysM peptidoglycan-binding domain-containing protein [Pseudobdellovibrio sp.]
MKTKLVLSLLLLVSLRAHSQATDPANDAPATTQESADNTSANNNNKPKSRVRNKNDVPPAETSSFMGDSDNLDALKTNRDNIKGDAEPVLEEIKDLSSSETRKQKAEDQEKAKAEADAKAAEVKKQDDIAKGLNLTADSPDLALEKKFHDIYKKYNVNPTPEDVWAAASEKQTARLYQVQKGDTLWSISKILFGDPNFWPKLWSLNKQGILNPHFINPKMKVYFFEGDEQNSPTISVGELEAAPAKAPEQAEVATPLTSNTPRDIRGREDLPAKGPVSSTGVNTTKETNPELAKLSDASDSAEPVVGEDGNIYATKIPYVDPKYRRKPPAPYRSPHAIPQSLPLQVNATYYDLNTVKSTTPKIDLGKPIKSEFFYNNDIVLTDLLVETEVRLKITEVQKMRCTTGRLLKDISYSGDLLSEYDMYERIDDVNTSTGVKYAYRYVGKAKSYQEHYLRVIDCKGIISTDFLILPKDKMKELATQKTSDEDDARIIGGPDLNQQKFFSTLYYGYIDFGTHAYNVGQDYKTISEITDKVNGEFKVVEKFGSYGIVIFTNVKDQIAIGDRVLVQ